MCSLAAAWDFAGRHCANKAADGIGGGTPDNIHSFLKPVGGLPFDFLMQAVEYVLSLRLLDAGWDIRTFDDLHVTHLKTPGARFSKRVTRLDVRNNLVLIARYFPEAWVGRYLWEWGRRYWVIASSKGHRAAFVTGLAEAVIRIIRGVGRRPVSDKTFDRFARIDETRQRLARHSFRPRSLCGLWKKYPRLSPCGRGVWDADRGDCRYEFGRQGIQVLRN